MISLTFRNCIPATRPTPSREGIKGRLLLKEAGEQLTCRVASWKFLPVIREVGNSLAGLSMQKAEEFVAETGNSTGMHGVVPRTIVGDLKGTLTRQTSESHRNALESENK